MNYALYSLLKHRIAHNRLPLLQRELYASRIEGWAVTICGCCVWHCVEIKFYGAFVLIFASSSPSTRRQLTAAMPVIARHDEHLDASNAFPHRAASQTRERRVYN